MKCIKVTADTCRFSELKVGDCFFISKEQKQFPMIKLPQVECEKSGKANAFSLLDNEFWYFHSSFPITPLPDAEFRY